VVLLSSSLLNAAYFLPIVYKAFFEKSNDPHDEKIREVPLVVFPIIVTAIMSLLIGLFPDYVMNLVNLVR
jgi:multicomponent Na+:H+ antiporter subunit D